MHLKSYQLLRTGRREFLSIRPQARRGCGASKLLKRDLPAATLCGSGRGKITISNIIDEEDEERCAMDLGSVMLFTLRGSATS
jgi:hypothetical protein